MIDHIHLLLLDGISTGELFFVFLIILIFFGSKSIPKMARTFGRGLRQIRDASQEIQDDINRAAFDEPQNNESPNKNDKWLRIV